MIKNRLILLLNNGNLVLSMSYIHIDESGDLGSKQASSKYFVMAAIKVEDSKKN